MLKKGLFGMMTLIAGIMLIFGFTACNDSNDGGGGIPSAIVGEWASKSNPSVMVFKITSDGTFTSTGQSGGDFDKITVSGNTIEIKYSGTLAASFDYSISNGEMAVSNATGFMVGIAMLSPFVKIGGGNGGGLSTLVGNWEKGGTTIFEVTSAGKFIMNETTYDISVSGSTATLKFSGQTVGTFDYAINSNQMVLFNGTGIGITVAAFSPLGKTSGGVPGIPDESEKQVFIVWFDLNGGTGNASDYIEVIRGNTVPRPSDPVRAGYMFIGWINADDDQEWDFNTPIYHNITLIAMWDESESEW